jgi:hypothetical protein
MEIDVPIQKRFEDSVEEQARPVVPYDSQVQKPHESVVSDYDSHLVDFWSSMENAPYSIWFWLDELRKTDLRNTPFANT